MRKYNFFSKKNFLIVILLTIFCFFGMTTLAVEEGQSSFSYSVIFPENQRNNEIGYYDLKMNPSQEQIVQIEFSNPSNKNVVVDISLNGAKTNSNGVIEYGNNNIKADKSLKYEFKDIVSAPDKVELKPSETKTIDFKIKMPETSFDGVILGGIQLLQEGQDKVEKNQGSMVINEYAYVIGMVLQVTDKKVEPKLELNKVRAGQSNFKNTVYVEYSNVNPVIVNNMTTEVQISKKGEKLVRFERKQSKMRMAPNTFISFPVSMNGEQMEAGKYVAEILVTADEGVNEHWTQEFEITSDEADKFNERDVGLVQETGINWKLIILAVLGFFILVLIIFIIINTMKKNKKKKNKRKKK